MSAERENPPTILSHPPLPDHEDFRVMRVQDLRGGAGGELRPRDAEGVFAAFVPVVYGIGAAFIPEDRSAAERVAAAVFHAFSLRWRHLPRRTFIGVWLFNASVIAARRERKRLKLPRRLANPAVRMLFKLSRLRTRSERLVLLHELFGLPTDAVAELLHTRPKRVARRVRKVLAQLNKPLRKRGLDAHSLLAELRREPPEEALRRVRELRGEPRHAEWLAWQTLRSWRWLRWRTALRRILVGAGATVAVIALLFGTFIYLATHGYLTALFIRMEQRQALKEFPEMRQPARPWPVTQEERALASSNPRSAEDLFRTTNIWPVKLTFTTAELKRMEPSHVPPVREMFKNGRITLRNPKAKRSGLAGVLGFQFNWVEARLDFDGMAYDKVGVRYRGNGTYLNSIGNGKQSLKVDVNKFVKANQLAGVHELNLLNTVVDFSYMHDPLAEELFHQLGAVGPRTAYAYVTVETEKSEIHPRGLFVVVENIDGDFAADRFGTKKAPIFKPVTYDLFQDLGNDWGAYAEIYDLKTKATPEQLQRVIDFSRLVSHGSDQEFARQLPDFLDLDEFAGYLAGHVLLSSYDGFLVNGQNYYLYLDPRSNKFGLVPWDQDHAWGDFGHIGTAEQRETASIWHPSTYSFRFLERVMKVEAFRAVYRAKLETALGSSFSKEKLFPRIDELAKVIRPAVAAESAFRLKRFDQAVSDQWLPGPRNGAPEGPRAPVHQIKRFITNRIQSVRDQLDGKSEGARLTGFR